MKRSISILIGLGCLIAIGGARVNGQAKAIDFSSISRAEIELLLADVAETNPTVVKQLAEDPAMKKKQIADLRELLAFASQAQRDGLAADPINKQELENIYAETLAVNYDREINKGKAKMPAFGFITKDQVKAYWAEKETAGQRTHETEFNDFLNAKIALLRTSSPDMKDREISKEEKDQSRDVFAKIRIYKAAYEQKAKAGTLPKPLIDKTNLSVKLQQAQFLARLCSEKIAERSKATDADISKYIAANPTTASELPARDYARNKIEEDNEKRLTAEIVAANNIQVADDFTVPVVSPTTVKKEPVPSKRPVTKRP